MNNLIKLDAFGNIYVDAFVGTEANELLFISMVGSQTEIRRLQSMVTLGQNGGIASLVGRNDSQTMNLRINNPDHLAQHVGVIPKTLFGDLVQLWVYNQSLLSPDFSNGLGYYLADGCGSDLSSSIWNSIKSLAEVPLLDAWMNDVLEAGHAFYKTITGYSASSSVALNAYKIDLTQDFTGFIESQVRAGRLVCD